MNSNGLQGDSTQQKEKSVDGQRRQSSADKTLETLMALGELGMQSGGSVRLADLVAFLGHPRPTVHRLLGELKRFGFAEQEANNGRYRLGPKILLLSAQCLGGLDLRRIAQPLVRNLVDEVGSTAHIGVRDGANIIYIDKFEALVGARLASSIGQRRKVSSTALGKAILAFSDSKAVEEVLAEGLQRMTSKSIVSAPKFRAELRNVAERGWAIDDEECEMGIRCAAAPIFDHTGSPVAALSVSTIASQVSRTGIERLAAKVAATAKSISVGLGSARRG